MHLKKGCLQKIKTSVLPFTHFVNSYVCFNLTHSLESPGHFLVTASGTQKKIQDWLFKNSQ